MRAQIAQQTHIIDIMNVGHIKHDVDSIVLHPIITTDDTNNKLHVYIDNEHIFSSFELHLDGNELLAFKIIID